MQVSKIQLSHAEMELFCNAEVILTKNRIIHKVVELLNRLQQQMVSNRSDYPFSVPAKVSKGENYEGLPYVVLDYPRESGQGNLFFIRSMFWWGNFFSSTLHISGNYKDRFAAALKNRFAELAAASYYIGINTDPWVHHFDKNNFAPVNSLSPKQYQLILQRQEHIKIARKWPLEKWDEAATFLLESWNLLLSLIASGEEWNRV